MKGLNKLAIVAAAVAAFVASSVWYAVSGNATMELSGTGSDAAATIANPAYTALFVVAQSLVVAFVLSYFVVRLGVAGPKDAVRLGVLAWIFPAMILLGSVVHENVPWMLATIHAGDWLVKLVLMAAILGARRGGPSEAKECDDRRGVQGREEGVDGARGDRPPMPALLDGCNRHSAVDDDRYRRKL